MVNFSQKELDYINQNSTEYSAKIYMSINKFENPVEYDIIVRVGGVYELSFKDFKSAMRFANSVTWKEFANGKIEVDGVDVIISMDESKSQPSYFRIACGNNQQMAEKLVRELRKQYISQRTSGKFAESILAK